MARKFFTELELKEPNQEDYIRQVILGKYKGEDFEIDNDVLRTDFEILLDHYIEEKNKRLVANDYIQLLISQYWIVGKDKKLHRPQDIYLENKLLELYFSDKSNISFVDIDFYSSVIVRYNETIVSEFFQRLGVKKNPQIKRINRFSIWDLSNRLIKQISTTNYQVYYIDEDFVLDGFNEFCEGDDIDRDVSIYLWNEVLPSIQFSQYESLKLCYRRKYARTYEYIYYPSSFKDALMNNKWLMDKEGYVVSAKDIALEDLDPEYNRNNGLVQFLGIEKREKSIIELGGTKEQQEQMDLGKRLQNLAE